MKIILFMDKENMKMFMRKKMLKSWENNKIIFKIIILKNEDIQRKPIT